MKKVILITGTSTGFGALMVRTFAREGYTVVATMRNTKGHNLKSAEEFKLLPNTEVVDMDVADGASVKSAINSVYTKHGKIDVLVNNAGVYGGGLLEAYTIPQIQKLFDINVWGVLRVNNEVLPHMRAAKEGLIITVSSQVGRISLPLQAPYNATKFALEGLIEGQHAELIGQGVETVLIEPGGYKTEIITKAHVNADREGILESYGPAVPAIQQELGEVFTRLVFEESPDPQLVADAALGLVTKEKGTRPLRTPLDVSSKGVDIEYNEATEQLKKRWISAYGFGPESKILGGARK